LSGTRGPAPGPRGPPGPFTRERNDDVRNKPKWIIGATLPIATGSLALMVAGTLPAAAQENPCPHHAAAATAVIARHSATPVKCVEIALATPVKAEGTTAVTGTTGYKSATPVKAEGTTAVLATKAGKAAKALSGAISIKACPADFTPGTGHGGKTGAAAN